MKRHLRNHLRLRMLRAIVAIEEHKSLLKASGALGITQPALTRTLREVETILGGQIFERHSRGVHLTAFGRIAYDSARRMLAEIDRLDDDLDRFISAEVRTVAIGATAPAAIGVLPGFFSHLREQAPDLNVLVSQGTKEELAAQLLGGEIAFAVGRLHPDADLTQFEQHPIYDERVCILARAQHPIFSSGPITPEILAAYPVILPIMSEQVDQEIQSMVAKMGMVLAGRYPSLPFLRELLHGSDHLTISPPQSMGGDIARGTMRVLPFNIQGPPRPAGLLLPRNHALSDNEQRVMTLLEEYLGDSSVVDQLSPKTHPAAQAVGSA